MPSPVIRSRLGACSGVIGSGGSVTPVDTFTSTYTNGTAVPGGSSPIGTYTYDRNTSPTWITDFEGLVKEIPADAIAMRGQRAVRNLATGLVTETISGLTIGNEYQVTINGGSGDTAQLVAGVSGTPTLTADGTNRISWNSGTPVTATATSITVIVTGTLTELLFEDVTGQTVQTPSENVDPTTDYGAGVDGFKYFPYENANTVNGSGVVSEVQGSTITVPTTNKGVEVWEARTTLIGDSDDLSNSSYWRGQASSVGIAAITPNDSEGSDGGQSMCLLQEDALTSAHYTWAIGVSITTGNTYVVSAYVKANSGSPSTRVLRLRLSSQFPTTTVDYDPSDGSTSIAAGSPVDYGMVELESRGIYLVWLTQTADSTGSDLPRFQLLESKGGASSYLGNSSSLYLDGANVQQGAFVSPVIRASSGSETRNADDLNHDPGNYEETGFCVLDFFVTADQLANHATSPTILTVGKALFADYVSAYINDATTVTVDFVTAAGGGAGGKATGDFTVAAGNQYKLAFTWDKVSGAINGSINGGSVVNFTGASAADILATADAATLEIGKYNDTQFLNGTVLSTSFGADLLSDTDLQTKATI